MSSRNWTLIEGQDAWRHDMGGFVAFVQLKGAKYYCSFDLAGQRLDVCGGGFDTFAAATKHCVQMGKQLAMFAHPYSYGEWHAK